MRTHGSYVTTKENRTVWNAAARLRRYRASRLLPRLRTLLPALRTVLRMLWRFVVFM